MAAIPVQATSDFIHESLDCGVELGVDRLPERKTVALVFRMLAGLADEPAEMSGVGSIVERTLSKGTRRYTGQQLADAFDALGASWGTLSGRQSAIVRVLCLPQYTLEAVDLVAELLARPTFPDDACDVAVELAQQELKHMEDEPHDLVRVKIQELTLGPVLGRYPGGAPETLAKLSPPVIRGHWERIYAAGRMQVAAAGPVDDAALAARLDKAFAGFGSPDPQGRTAVTIDFTPARAHRHKQVEQEYIAITLPGVPKGHDDFATEQVALGVLAGGMSGRLFTEVREKEGLVYWVGAWHEQPRRYGFIHLGASTTPEKCDRTYEVLLRELRRLGEDLTREEVERARDGLIAQYETEDDLTRARAAALSEDLFHFGRPIGRAPVLQALQDVTLDHVIDYARRLPLDRLCVATLGPRELAAGDGG